MPVQYIAYLIAPPKREDAHLFFTTDELAQQEQRIQHFLESHEGALISTYVEVGTKNRQRHRWPELKNALNECKEKQAQLIIAEIHNLTNNDAFVRTILQALQTMQDPEFELYCLDQPFINATNFHAIAQHSQELRKYHGELVKEGLKRACTSPGNPHAGDIINRVNRPKIDNAIIYSLMLMPVIHDYQQKGYSQRKMVQMLNEAGFHAPEGGDWVLSQLQKMLHRIKINEAALLLEKKFAQFHEKNYNDEKIIQSLESLGIVPPKGKTWSKTLVHEVQARIDHLEEIQRLNEVMRQLLPIFEQYHIDELTPGVMLNELKTMGVNLPGEWGLKS